MRCLYNGIHPCGKCPACLANRQRAFCFRLDQERDSSKFYFWLTLQYDDDHVPRFPDGEMCFSKDHCRNFFEKLRKRYSSKGLKFKHFLVSEYGPNGTHRPHYHCLLLVYNDFPLAKNYEIKKELKDFIVNSAWEHGHVTEKSFHGRVLSYLTKYCLKPELLGQYHRMKPFTLISKGIGISFLDSLSSAQKEQMKSNLDFSYRYGKGKIQLPRYYVDKILPHSIQDYVDALLNGDIEKFQQIIALRSKIGRHQTDLNRSNFNRNIKNKSVRQLEIERNGAWSNFYSKVKSRKDL